MFKRQALFDHWVNERVTIEDVLDKAQDPDALAKKIATARRQMMQMEMESEQLGGAEGEME